WGGPPPPLSRQPLLVARRKPDGCDCRDAAHREGTEQDVSRARAEQQPRGAGPEVGNREHPTRHVVRPEERRGPPRPLPDGLADGRHGEGGKTRRPERLLSPRPLAVRPRQEEDEQQGDER